MKNILKSLAALSFYAFPVFASTCLDEMPRDLSPSAINAFVQSQIICEDKLDWDIHHASPLEQSECLMERAKTGFRISLIQDFGFNEGETLFRKMIRSQESMKNFANLIQSLGSFNRPIPLEEAKHMIRKVINGNDFSQDAGIRQDTSIRQTNKSHRV